jgi:hypothetical protein
MCSPQPSQGTGFGAKGARAARAMGWIWFMWLLSVCVYEGILFTARENVNGECVDIVK